MTLLKTPRGTGITKRDFVAVRLYDGDPSENARLVRELLQQAAKTLDQFLDEVEAGAAAILSAAKLPTTPGLYALDRAGKWSRVSRSKKGPLERSASKLIAPIADAAGFELDTKEGHAARIADCISSIRQARTEGNWDHTVLSGIRLGSLLTEFDFKMGTADGPSRGGIKGAESRWGHHGTRERYGMLCEKFDQAGDKGLSKMEAYADVARKNRVGRRTVQRAVANGMQRGGNASAAPGKGTAREMFAGGRIRLRARH